MKTTKKITSVMLSFIFMLSLTVQALAASALPQISASKPIICYTLKSSGKVYAYKAADLKEKTGGYIDCATDECKIIKISGNAVQVTYPVSNGTKTAWFYRSEFTDYNIANGADSKFTQASKITTYRRSGGGTAFGYISAGDVCYKLSTKGGYTQVIYPVSGGYKMGWITSNKTTSSLGSPVPSGCYFNKKTQDGSWYGYHDINVNVSTNTPVYAISDGTVTFKQAYTTYGNTKKLTSYGNFIEFSSTDGSYKAKYCHLSKFNGATPKITATVQKTGSSGTITLGTKKVKKGDILGYIGKTGNATGVHLHFELYKNGTRIDPTSAISGLTR